MESPDSGGADDVDAAAPRAGNHVLGDRAEAHIGIVGRTVRTITTVITALWLTACSLPATAGVVYNWVELEGNPELGPMTGRIE